MNLHLLKWPRGQIARVGLLLCAVLVAAGGVYAQSGGGFAIKWTSIDGGAQTVTGGGFELRGTVGQPEGSLGLLTAGTFSLQGGITVLPAPIIVPPSGAAVSPIRNYYTDSNVRLSWSRVTYATGYWVQVSKDSIFTVAQLVYNQVLPESQLSVVAALPGNGTYYWRVRAMNGAVAGNPSPYQTIVVAIP